MFDKKTTSIKGNKEQHIALQFRESFCIITPGHQPFGILKNENCRDSRVVITHARNNENIDSWKFSEKCLLKSFLTPV